MKMFCLFYCLEGIFRGLQKDIFFYLTKRSELDFTAPEFVQAIRLKNG